MEFRHSSRMTKSDIVEGSTGPNNHGVIEADPATRDQCFYTGRSSTSSPIEAATMSHEPFPMLDENHLNTHTYGDVPLSINSNSLKFTNDLFMPNVLSNFKNFLNARVPPEPSAAEHDCCLFGAPRTKQGSGPGIAIGTVAAPPEKMESVSKSSAVLPVLLNRALMNVSNEVSDDLLEEELILKTEELEVRRRLLELHKRQGRAAKSETVPTAGTKFSTPCHPGQSRASETNPFCLDPVESLGRALRPLVLGASLPKIEVDSFDGSPKNYFTFLRNFEGNVVDKLVDEGSKLSYLLHYCRGRAKEAIRHCALLPKEVGFTEAMKILHQQFGRRHDIMQAVSKEVFMGPRLVAGDVDGLRGLASQMKGCQTMLMQLDYGAELNCTTNLIKAVERLPHHLQERWAEVAEGITECGREPDFSDLLRFVEKRVAVSASQYGQLAARSETRTSNSSGHSGIRYSRCNVEVGVPYEKVTLRCPVCKSNHDISNCGWFSSQSLEQRKAMLKNTGRCFVCLKANHVAKSCRVQIRCAVPGCGRRHHTLVHEDKAEQGKEERTKSTLCGATSNINGVCLGFVPIRLVGPKASVSTYAFLDNGSDTTLLDESIARTIGLQGQPCQMMFRTLHGTSATSCSKVSIELQSLDQEHSITADSVYTVKQLPLTQADVVHQSEVDRWTHLKDVSFESLTRTGVGILIGCDIPEAHWVLEQRLSSNNEPCASKTIFGWDLRGPCRNEARNEHCVNLTGVRPVSLDDPVQRVYELDYTDGCTSENKEFSVEDRRALNMTDNSVISRHGHFAIGLPWRQDRRVSQNNKEMRADVLSFKPMYFLILKLVQEREFSKELRVLRSYTVNPRKVGRLERLLPALIGEALHLGGRIRSENGEGVELVIIPSRSAIRSPLIRHYHESAGHMSAFHVHASIRRRFWILKGMAADKRVLTPPIMLVKTEDGSSQLCVDHKRLGDATNRDSFPLPRTDTAIDASHKAKLSSTLALAPVYWQVEVRPEDLQNTNKRKK
ncbi:uncharacterized protein DEA37_0001153 [Paragonimus westermani]|uniref:Peptidase aspartic putative domain-containing protein n=1 Tax=Paragonimus westermani TaxID=34504 RepID=A0A5J4NP77_9TREM|nr:uncharacterized protein DEA37_0001153 [Paragonimus westermani]